MSVAASQEVDAFFANDGNRAAYLRLLDRVERLCGDIKHDVGEEIVRAIYSRKDKQNGNAFKTPAKIAKALTERRRSDPRTAIASIEDIIGLTLVVYYPDQIDMVRDRIVHHVEHDRRLRVDRQKSVIRNGYHGYHIVLQSNDPGDADLKCEVQIKTMMHDAWSAKMHDLNYKPHGHTDLRLSAMMSVFGDALESIERQSVLLRTLIHERWNAEVGRRRAVRHTLFEQLQSIRKGFSEEADGIYRALYAATLATPPAGPPWSSVTPRVVEHARQSAREGAWLALCLADVSNDPEHAALAARRVARFLGEMRTDGTIGEAAEGLTDTSDSRDVWLMALGLSACGNLNAAIEVSDYILLHLNRLPDEDLAMVRFNLANFLVEQAIFEPAGADGTALRQRVEDLLAACSHIEREDPSAFHDLRGMLEVAVATEAGSVREAIMLIERGLSEANEVDRDIARLYYELHIRLAWRRLLELEAEVATQPPPSRLPAPVTPAGPIAPANPPG
ncbi:MAG TPA: RelA/SpoT domain-containing protein [Rhodopila sp.]|uniref:RelA/SpoT domain-containing protein n=1 Tax=Rhodopila sp. TaxID=2480087 RepID=UPI002BE60FFB|nr:RelA/SpoT domain-containing protein [Rhodopila sp.]HVY16117.1 RelA/SpoT domain-containing protein [Rhodopila sp.]